MSAAAMRQMMQAAARVRRLTDLLRFLGRSVGIDVRGKTRARHQQASDAAAKETKKPRFHGHRTKFSLQDLLTVMHDACQGR